MDTYIQPLNYSYKNQVHLSTGVKLFELVLSRTPSDPTISCSTTEIPKDRKTEMPAGQMQQLILRRLTHIVTKTNGKEIGKVATEMKPIVLEQGPNTPSSHAGQSILVDRPLSYALRKVERIYGEESSKLLLKSTGPYQFLAENRNTVTDDENGVPNMMSIDKGTVIPVVKAKEGAKKKKKMTLWRRRK